VQGGRSRRPLAIGLALAVILAGVVLALVLAGDDEGEKSAATERPQSETDRPTVPKHVPTVTETTPETQAPPRDSRQIEQTVTTFVESAEQSDSQRACSQVAGGEGKQLPGCAEAVGIDLRALPSSDELQVDAVRVSGSRADAKLSSGASFRLKQLGGKWKLSGFSPG
jgi:hypothetical protein